jgi:hypothetical protein
LKGWKFTATGLCSALVGVEISILTPSIATAAIIMADVIVLQPVLEACRRASPWRSAPSPLALS